ncbi:MAG: transposase [Planctomycetes bacterium]|nr:transposase [Planctomycetota bacterium]
MLVEIEAEAHVLRSLATSDQGPLAKALTYLENQWPTLLRFLEDGRVPIHNNSCENAIRPIAVGRKNWLFAGSERGGHAAATIYSLIESCKRVGVDPFLYLRDVLVRVCTHPAAESTSSRPRTGKSSSARKRSAERAPRERASSRQPPAAGRARTPTKLKEPCLRFPQPRALQERDLLPPRRTRSLPQAGISYPHDFPEAPKNETNRPPSSEGTGSRVAVEILTGCRGFPSPQTDPLAFESMPDSSSRDRSWNSRAEAPCPRRCQGQRLRSHALVPSGSRSGASGRAAR